MTWSSSRPDTQLTATTISPSAGEHCTGITIPANCIITDNGTQFTGKRFLEFCDDHHIRVLWSAVAHSKTNGQVERANGMVLQGLKPRIFNKLNKHGKK
jgi:transposase InsO family protein